MMEKLMPYLKKPELIAECSPKLWNDEHISKGMLESHLDFSFEAASRKVEFMDASVEWISRIAPPEAYKMLLDLGCGPGLYAERLDDKGYVVTGVDFSRRSIDYANKQAIEKGKQINYIYQNYLEINFEDQFDLVILIYCDYGVLSVDERKILLQKIYRSLRKGGKLIFDVFTPKNYEGKHEVTTWYLEEGGGFFKPSSYLCLEAHYIYEDNIRLNQYVVIDDKDEVEVFKVWDHYFTRRTIVEEVKEAGFRNVEVYSDVAGKPYNEESKTIALVMEKE